MNILTDPVTAGLESALDLRTRQHALTASNVANADTPGYRAKHMDFRASFDAVLDSLNTGENVELDDLISVDEALPDPQRLDGNSVRREVEMLQLGHTQTQYDATVEVLNRRLAMLEYAASDGKR